MLYLRNALLFTIACGIGCVFAACGGETYAEEEGGSTDGSSDSTSRGGGGGSGNVRACFPGETSEDGEVCVCTDRTGVVCDPDAEGECICEFAPEYGGGGGGGSTGGHWPDPYRFVLVEDLTSPAGGSAPGADIDAIVIVRRDGTLMPATTVEDFGGIVQGDFVDPNHALGVSDSDCEVQNFVALGGADANGYIVVGFADQHIDGTFTMGDAVVVSEIGGTMCGNDQFTDDPYAVSVSVSKDLSTFVEIATDVLGNYPITVP